MIIFLEYHHTSNHAIAYIKVLNFIDMSKFYPLYFSWLHCVSQVVLFLKILVNQTLVTQMQYPIFLLIGKPNAMVIL